MTTAQKIKKALKARMEDIRVRQDGRYVDLEFYMHKPSDCMCEISDSAFQCRACDKYKMEIKNDVINLLKQFEVFGVEYENYNMESRYIDFQINWM
jgi:hypothetical protein